MPSIKYKKKTYAGATFPVLEMTKAEYDALSEAKKMDGTVYMITDDTGGWEAERSVYDNTQSGLTATNVQDALDEIVAHDTATAITILPAANVVIDENHSQKKGGYAFICVRGHVTANFNTQIFSFSGAIISPANYTIPIGVGAAWEITKTGYGFIGASAFIAKLTSGEYFHIVATLPCA